MDDELIVQLYWDRSERAIRETDRKYGSYCKSIAFNILHNMEDSEECVSDTYMDAWNGIPPHRPSILAAFLGKITRRIAIDRWRSQTRLKRGGGETVLVLDELDECIPGSEDVEKEIERKELVEQINLFLDSLSATERRIFLSRYWYMKSIKEIARSFGFSQSKVMSMLHRLRQRLRRSLEEGDYEI